MRRSDRMTIKRLSSLAWLLCYAVALCSTQWVPTCTSFTPSPSNPMTIPPRVAALPSLLPSLSPSSSSSSQLQLFFGSSTDSSLSKKRKLNGNGNAGMAYIIERIDKVPNDRVFREIANMCINVFFKEQLDAEPNDRIAPWKEAQISYLKSLQTSDLKQRRKKYHRTNEMFVAYEVKQVTKKPTTQGSRILDLDQIYNLQTLKTTTTTNNNNNSSRDKKRYYVRGDIIGFVEITQRPYGLGRVDEVDTLRPILTNLAVSNKAREYGIGSKLLDLCETTAARDWQLNEIILEVEDYNTSALAFYKKRGYMVMFADPASRRFDVNGVMLKKIRCTRQILRKVLAQQRAQSAGEGAGKVTMEFFQKFRETVGV